MFTPMALTVVLALAGAMMLSLTFVPAAVALLVTGTGRREGEPAHARRARGSTRRCSMRRFACAPVVVGLGAVLLVVVGGVAGVAPGQRVHPDARRGRHRDPGAAHSRHQPRRSRSQMQAALEKALLRVPRGQATSSRKIGTAEVATDPMPPNVSDSLRHAEAARASGPTRRTPKAELVAAMRSGCEQMPGNNYEFTQPIQMRFNELISGVRCDVGVKVFGDDLDTLLSRRRRRSQAVLAGVPGAADVKIEQVTGLPMLTGQARPRRAGALRPQPGATCRRWSRPRSAARRPGRSSRATGASTSSCACPSICAIDLEALARCRSRCRPAAGAAETAAPPHATVPARRHSRALRAAVARSPRSRSRPGRTRSAARTASAASWSRANVRGRDLGSFVAEAQRHRRRAGEAAGRLLDRLGRTVRAPASPRRSGCRSWCRSRCC